MNHRIFDGTASDFGAHVETLNDWFLDHTGARPVFWLAAFATGLLTFAVAL